MIKRIVILSILLFFINSAHAIEIIVIPDYDDGIARDGGFDKGRYESAIESYKNSIQENPDNFTAWNNLGYALWKGRPNNNLNESLDAFDKAISIDRNRSSPHRGKAWILFQQKIYTEAMDEIDKALSIDKYYFQAIYIKGTILYNKGKIDDANNQYKQVIEITNLVIDKYPKYLSAFDFKADALISLNRSDEALTTINKAIELEPNDASIWRRKGMVLFNANRYDEALIATDKALELEQNDALIWLQKFQILNELNRYDEALIAIKKALVLDPNDATVLNLIGLNLYRLNRYDEALIAINKSLELDSKKESSWLIKGWILFSLEHYNEALTAANRAIELDPNDALFWNTKGKLLFKLERYAEALTAINKALELKSKDANSWYIKGGILDNLGRYEEALTATNKALELDPNDADAKNLKNLLTSKLKTTDSTNSAFYNIIVILGIVGALLAGRYLLKSKSERDKSVSSAPTKIGELKTNLRVPTISALEPEIKATKTIYDLQVFRGYSVLPNNDIKFGIRLTNNTNFVITDVNVILDYTINLFSMKDSEIQHLGNTPPNSARTATYLLKPLGCIHNEQINALITYKDHTGKKQTLHMRPKEVHCVCPFLKEKTMSEGEYSRLAKSSEFVQEGISFKGISIDDLAKFIGETCRHMLYRVREYDVEGKKVIYLSGESLGEKA